jgi:hypothetical protein
MKTAICSNSPFFGYHEELFRSPATQMALSRLQEALKENGITIRFGNGYGVTIRAISPDGNDGTFEMLLLRFHGAGINDYRTAQYAPLPEYTQGPWHEIVSLCRKVALLPRGGHAISPGE